MTLQKIGEGYVNPEEISHIIKSERYNYNIGSNEACYGVYMKNSICYVVSAREFEEFRDRYYRYTEPNYTESENVF